MLHRLARSVRSRFGANLEPELALLPFLVDPRRAAIDVGAACGEYVESLIPLAASVIGIEANADAAKQLTRLYGGRARIICAAASSTAGSANLRVPVSGFGLGTIAPENALEGDAVEVQEVARIRLDDLSPGPVGFIKVDIEGHELEALRGAVGILERDRPTLLVEAEERHRPHAVASIRALLEPFGYVGFMLTEGRISSIEAFDLQRDQMIPDDQVALLNSGRYKGRYINNFVFVA